MIPASFEYAAPTSLSEVFELLERHGDEARILAGGHSLIPLMKLRLVEPTALIDLRRVPGLRGVTDAGNEVLIGAATTHADIASSPEVRRMAPALADAAESIGDRQVRARGTIGGSIAHADPGADLPGSLIALGATVVLQSGGGERTVSAEAFFRGLMETDVRSGELITEVRVPAAPRSVYVKWANPASHYAIAGVAVAAVNGGVRIGVSGAAPSAFRAVAAEAALAGGLTPAAIDAAASTVAGGRELLGDLHASEEYRRHLVGVLTRSALSRLS